MDINYCLGEDKQNKYAIQYVKKQTEDICQC